MKFAKIVFWIAGIWGLLVIPPLYFIFDLIGHKDPPPITHPGFYYGFVGTALAWQVAFCFIATNPARFRPLMIPSILEKAAYSAAIIILVLQGRTNQRDLVFAATDLLLGVLFVIAYFKSALGYSSRLLVGLDDHSVFRELTTASKHKASFRSEDV